MNVLKAPGYSKVAISSRALQLVLRVSCGHVGSCWNLGAYLVTMMKIIVFVTAAQLQKTNRRFLVDCFYRRLLAKEETNREKRAMPIVELLEQNSGLTSYTHTTSSLIYTLYNL